MSAKHISYTLFSLSILHSIPLILSNATRYFKCGKQVSGSMNSNFNKYFIHIEFLWKKTTSLESIDDIYFILGRTRTTMTTSTTTILWTNLTQILYTLTHVQNVVRCYLSWRLDSVWRWFNDLIFEAVVKGQAYSSIDSLLTMQSHQLYWKCRWNFNFFSRMLPLFYNKECIRKTSTSKFWWSDEHICIFCRYCSETSCDSYSTSTMIYAYNITG